MKILSVVGPLGVGKTTFSLNLIQRLQTDGYDTTGKFAYVVNDEGALVDGELAKKRSKVVAMTNGCFTCEDPENLRKVLNTLDESGISWVIMEGFGLTPGIETKEFLESSGYDFHIVCLLSLRHFKQDVVRYSYVIDSHVQSATVVVGITKYQPFGDSIFMIKNLKGIPERVSTNNVGIPLVLVPDSQEIPSTIMGVFSEVVHKNRSKSRSVNLINEVHEDSCDCDHHHHHVHGMEPYFFELREGVTLYQIQNAFAGKDFVIRVKGSVEGKMFNEIYGEWLKSVDDVRCYITFYSTKKLDFEIDLPLIVGLINRKEKISVDGPGYQLLREETVSRKETVSMIESILVELPDHVLFFESDEGISVVTHPEKLQLVKEMSRRPYVKDEWFPIVLKRCMEYWIRCADFINENRDQILRRDISKNLRELGVSMTWWVNRYGDFFGGDMVSAIEKLRPGYMVAGGVLTMNSLNSNPDRAFWEAHEICEALSYGAKHGEEASKMIEAAQYCMSLADSQALKDLWASRIAESF